MNERIMKIIDDANNLQADESMVVTGFGQNKDLTLHITKDDEYDEENAPEDYNLVDVATKKDEKVIDDSVGIYVTDGCLANELERIWFERNMSTL